MKKLTLSLLVIAIATSSFAEINTLDAPTVKKIATNEIVTSLKIYNNIEVVLTCDELNEIKIVGEKNEVENISVRFNNGELIITGSRDFITNEKLVIYVPSKTLTGVFIHGSSSVSSSGVISNEMLDVTINGEGKSTIKTIGKIYVNTIGDFPLE